MATRRRATRRTLTSTLTDVQRRLKYVEARPNPTRLASQVVKRTNIEPRAVSTDQIALRSVTNTLIEQETLTEDELAVDSVGSAELQPGAVTSESFAPGSVDQTALGEDSVGQDQLQNDSVGSAQLQGSSVGAGEIANGAVTNSKLANNAVTEAKIDNGAVTGNKIAGDAITSDKIASNAVGSSEIAANAVGASELADNAVYRDNIGPGADILTSASNLGGLLVAVANAVSGHGKNVAFGADFGTSLNEIPRGNHSHSFTTNGTGATRMTDADYTFSGVPGHFHNYKDTYITGVTSSKRFKKNISNMKVDNPHKILELEPKKFQYKASRKQRQRGMHREWMYGYIVEELEDLGIEEAIGYDKDGKPTSIDYSVVTVMAIESVKSLRKELEAVKERLNDMENVNDNI